MGWSFFKSTGEEKSDAYETPNQTGVVVSYLDSFEKGIPEGWLLCYGQAVSRSTYLDLYKVIGTTYGSGDGSTTFNVPDLRGAMPMGDTMGSQDGGTGSGAISGGTTMAGQPIGTSGGATSVKLAAGEVVTASHQHELLSETSHHHSFTDNGHSHNIGATVKTVSTGAAYSNFIYAVGPANYTAWGMSASGSVDVSFDAAAPAGMELQANSKDATNHHNNAQPFVALLYIIKT